MNNWLTRVMSLILLYVPCAAVLAQQRDSLTDEARTAMLAAIEFMSEKVADHGGYVYQVSSDLKYREGEGIAAEGTVWVQPPGTPAVGLALLAAYQRTGHERALEAARRAAHCLVNGQLHSGGWQAHIDFGQQLRGKQAYRVDGPAKKKARNISTFDDDKTQSAVRFLASFDRATQFTDEQVHSATLFALDSILRNQFPNGGFGQVFEQPPTAVASAATKAVYPASWPRNYPGGDYWWFYTLNDNNLSRTIDTLLLAAKLYDQPLYHQAALKAADFLLLAQMPEPQPAWAQQYNFEFEPVWARKFEPPAISGGESQDVIETLLNVYEETGDRRYIATIARALEYLQSSQLDDGRLARFYELQTNRPLFMTTKYELTYEANDLPTHYGFIVGNRLNSLRRRYDKLSDQHSPRTKDSGQPDAAQVRAVIDALDDRGAWVENDQLRYHKNTEVKQVIKSATFIRNLDILSRYLAK